MLSWEIRLRLVRIVAAIVCLYVVLSIVAGVRLAEVTIHPIRRDISRGDAEKPQRYFIPSFKAQEVLRRSQDGVTLGAWYVRPAADNGSVVVILHGLSDNRLAGTGIAPMFLRSGYRVLLPDSRSHGESGGIATFGLKESRDIHDWITWLYATDAPRCTYGFGQSMGAAILLQSLAPENRFCAAVADSPFETFREAAYEHVGEFFGLGPRWFGRTLGQPTIFFGMMYGRLRYGINLMDVDPKAAVVATRVPVLLIHGLDDNDLLPENSISLHNAALSHTDLWLVPHAQHIGAYSSHPEEFEQRVLNWFASHH